MNQIDELRTEADLCRVEGAEDIAVMLDDAANTIELLARMCNDVEWVNKDRDEEPWCPWCREYPIPYGHSTDCDYIANHVAELAGNMEEHDGPVA